MGPKFVLLLLHLHLFILGYLTCPNKALILHCNFWKINNHAVGNKRAVWNRRAGGIFFSKSINVQTEIRPCRGDFFLKINKRAGQIPIQMQENKCAGGFFFSKTINVQTKIRSCRGDFLLKINKRACTSIRYTTEYVKYFLSDER